MRTSSALTPSPYVAPPLSPSKSAEHGGLVGSWVCRSDFLDGSPGYFGSCTSTHRLLLVDFPWTPPPGSGGSGGRGARGVASGPVPPPPAPSPPLAPAPCTELDSPRPRVWRLPCWGGASSSSGGTGAI